MTETEKPENPKHRSRSWTVLAAVAVPILLLAAIFSWVGGDRPDRIDDEVEQAANQPGPAAPDKHGEFAVQQATMGDFDSGRQVPSHSQQADFWYQARTGSDRYFSARENAQLAMLGRVDSPSVQDVRSALQNSSREEIDINEMSPGFWVAVRTSEDNLAAFTIKSHAGISPGTLRLDYLLWEDVQQ